MLVVCVFFFKQKTAYEMRISDWSSDVCSSDLFAPSKRLTAMVSLTALSLMLAGCGGGGGVNSTPAPPTPAPTPTPTPAPTPMPTPPPTPTPPPPATKIVGQPAVSTPSHNEPASCRERVCQSV